MKVFQTVADKFPDMHHILPVSWPQRYISSSNGKMLSALSCVFEIGTTTRATLHIKVGIHYRFSYYLFDLILQYAKVKEYTC